METIGNIQKKREGPAAAGPGRPDLKPPSGFELELRVQGMGFRGQGFRV